MTEQFLAGFIGTIFAWIIITVVSRAWKDSDRSVREKHPELFEIKTREATHDK